MLVAWGQDWGQWEEGAQADAQLSSRRSPHTPELCLGIITADVHTCWLPISHPTDFVPRDLCVRICLVLTSPTKQVLPLSSLYS